MHQANQYMKKISLFLLLATLATSVMAQEKKEYSSISKSISDDGKTLDIKVSYKPKGEKTQHYENSFDIRNLTKNDKEALVNRIMDSLGIPNNAPPAPKAPEAPKGPEAPKAPKKKRYAAVQHVPVNPVYTQPYA